MKKNKLVVVLSSIVVVYAILGFFILPMIIKDQLEKNVNQLIIYKAQVEKVEFNPFTLKIKLHNFEILDESKKVIALKELLVDFSLLKSIHEKHISFKRIDLIEPFISVLQKEDGSINLASILKEQPNKKPDVEEKSEPIPFKITKTQIINANVQFTHVYDNKPSVTDIDKLNYTFYELGTFKNSLASHSLNTTINKHTSLFIDGGFNLSPFKMYGNIKIEKLQPKEFLGLTDDLLQFELSNPTVDLAFGYQLDLTKELKLVINNANLQITDTVITQNSKETIGLKQFNINDLNLEYPKQKVRIESIALDSFFANITQYKDGSTNLNRLVKVSKEDPEQEKQVENQEDTSKKEVTPSKAKPWLVDLKAVTLLNTKASYENLKDAIKVSTDDINLNVNEIKVNGQDVLVDAIALSKPNIVFNDRKNKMDVQAKQLGLDVQNLSIKDNIINIASIKLSNPTSVISDKKNNMKIQAKKLGLDVQNLNMEKNVIKIDTVALSNATTFINDKKNKTSISTKNINVKLNTLKVNGDNIQIKNITLAKPNIVINDVKNKTKINANKLSVRINNLKKSGSKVSISHLKVNEPYVKIINELAKNKIIAQNLNLNVYSIVNQNNSLKIKKSSLNKPKIDITLEKKEVVKEEKTKETAVAKKEAKKSDFNLNIGPFKITNATMTFQDKNLPIPFKTTMSNLNGSFSELITKSSKPTKLKLEGKIDKYGYTRITGLVDHKDIKNLTDVNLIFKNIAVKNFTPYSGKFVGRELAGGKLNLNLKYNITKSNLAAQNSVIITDIELGEKVESPDAASIPLGLGIALLEDSNGVIDLNVPISGNVDDPKFSIAPIVWKAFANLIIKAVASPFSFLASLLGVDEEEIKSVEFIHGEQKLLDSEKETLDKIAQAFAKRPNLALKVQPSYNTTLDTMALQFIQFDAQINEAMKQSKEDDKYLQAIETAYLGSEEKQDIDKLKEQHMVQVKGKKEKEFDKDAYIKHIRNLLSAKIKVLPAQLEALATARVTTIKSYLDTAHAIKENRVLVKEKIVKVTKKDAQYIEFPLEIDIKKK